MAKNKQPEPTPQPRPNVRRCMHCNGAGKVWDERTEANTATCPACGGTGKVVISTI